MDINMAEYHGELRARLRVVEAGRASRAALCAALPSIPELLAGKEVLITGASGFLGRVLLEKLLRSCPEVRRVHLLLRSKRGVPAQQRIQDVVGVQLFEQLFREQPGARAKLVAVAGDCSELGLGLDAAARALLQERVSFVFHGAASVRFDDPLKKAVLLNTRGAREVVDLCRGMKHLQALIHISTAFTNINQDVTQERLYPTLLDWRQVIQAMETIDGAEQMDTLGPKLLGFHPNTYTFSKALAEQIMGEAAASLPLTIVRPTVVIGAVKEPIPGWLDNVNSPAAMWAGINKGVIRISKQIKAETLADYVPVDLIAKATMVTAWATATKQDFQESRDAVPVVNMAIGDVHPVPAWMMCDILSKSCRRAVPYTSAIRYPCIFLYRNRLQYYLTHFFYHIMFGVIVDLGLRLASKKPRLLRVYRKVEVILNALHPFSSKRFVFDTTNFWKLQLLIHPGDVEAFDFDIDSFDPRKDSPNQMIGVLEYAFKEKFNREEGLRHIDRLFWIEWAFYLLLVVLLSIFLILSNVLNKTIIMNK